MFLPDLLHKLLWVIYFGDIKIQLPNYRLNENTTVLNRKYTLLIHNPSNLKIILVQKTQHLHTKQKVTNFPETSQHTITIQNKPTITLVPPTHLNQEYIHSYNHIHSQTLQRLCLLLENFDRNRPTGIWISPPWRPQSVHDKKRRICVV